MMKATRCAFTGRAPKEFLLTQPKGTKQILTTPPQCIMIQTPALRIEGEGKRVGGGGGVWRIMAYCLRWNSTDLDRA